MKISQTTYESHQFLTIKNDANLEITFCSFGASIYSILYKGQTVTYHPDDFNDFLTSKKHCGKILGRVAGRIKNGEVIIDNKTYHLEKNEKGNTLHGGFNNLSFKEFAVETSESDDSFNVVFKYNSPALECGFPANVSFLITYKIEKKLDKFSIYFKAIPDSPTPINLSTHIYWRLGDKDILNHELFVNANERTVVDNKTLVDIAKQPIDKIFDFRKSKRISQDIEEVAKKESVANGYDHGYILNESNKPKIILKDNNIKLSVLTDMAMARIYTNNNIENVKMKSYGNDIVFGGIAIEPQAYFSSYRDLIVSPEKPYDQYITFVLEENNE